MSSLMVVLITQKWILLGILSELKRFFNNDSGSGKGVYLLCNGGSRNWSCPRQTIAWGYECAAHRRGATKMWTKCMSDMMPSSYLELMIFAHC